MHESEGPPERGAANGGGELAGERGSAPGDPSWLAAARTYAQDSLGPRAADALDRPAFRAEVGARLDRGLALEDALLGALFGLARIDQAVAGEFFAHFLSIVLRLRAPEEGLAPRLRRLADPDDLVQSVLGDLWPELDSLYFETRAQFLSLLADRVRWKASDHSRALLRQRRREDLRLADAPEELSLASGESSPVTKVSRAETAERMAIALGRLPERDRRLLRLHLRGEPLEGIARKTGLSYEAARKALRRARNRLGEVWTE
ncbi:MAG: sigma-70 family RNA polymerase sigma factor [Planctomycetota bacterium]